MPHANNTEVVTGCPTAATPEEVGIQAVADHRRDALFAAALVYQGNGTEASADWLNGQVTALADGFTEYLAPTPDFKECIEIPCSDDQAAELEAERVSSAVAEVGCRLLKKGYGPGLVSDTMDVVRAVIEERFVR